MNNIIVISGPSGCGKSTLINHLMEQHTDILFSTSHTTRPIRDNEIDGKDYYFISKEQFLQMIDNDEFVEWAQVYQNYYGTSCREIETKCQSGKSLMLNLDVQGAKNFKKKYPEALYIFVVPPSLEELQRRLKERENKMDPNTLKRLEVAREEMEHYHLYDYIVVNDNLQEAMHVLSSIYTAYQNTTARHEAFVKSLLVSKNLATDKHG